MVKGDARARLIRDTETKLRQVALVTFLAFDGVAYYVLHQCYLIWWS